MAGVELTRIYRHLLRSAPFAVRHNRAATKNIRRVLRDDFEDAIKSKTSSEELIKKAGSTLLFYLASNHSKDDPSDANLLAHRAISNISTFCYHHLSPHTSMQSNTRKKRVGGTDTSSLRRRRSMRKSSTPDMGSLALNSFESTSDNPTMAAPIEALVLHSLVVTPKRIRGPVYVAAAKSFIPVRWNGQRPVKNIQTSSAFISHLQAIVEATSGEIFKAKEKYDPDDPRLEALKVRIRKEKGEVKSALGKRKKDDDRQALHSQVAGLLHSVVERVQSNHGPWLGAHRFKRWATGAWLPP